MPTKDELITENEQLKAELAELKEQLAHRNAALSGGAEDGWIVTCPNPAYTGITAGVEFRQGKAFIPAGIKDAVRRVAMLVDDFGYTAEPATAGAFQESKHPEPEKKGNTLEDLMRQPAQYHGA
jgi:hypothetical protein